MYQLFWNLKKFLVFQLILIFLKIPLSRFIIQKCSYMTSWLLRIHFPTDPYYMSSSLKRLIFPTLIHSFCPIGGISHYQSSAWIHSLNIALSFHSMQKNHCNVQCNNYLIFACLWLFFIYESSSLWYFSLDANEW